MSAVEMVVSMYKAMNVEEKTDLMFELSSLAVKDGLVDMSGTKTSKVSSGRKPKGSGRKGYKQTWARTITGHDASMKGATRLLGDWINDVASEVPDNGYYVVAWRASKHYILCRNDGGASSVVENDGHKVELVGSVVGRFNKFSDLDAKVKEIFT